MSSNPPPGNSENHENTNPSNPLHSIENLGARLRNLDVDSIRRYLALKLGLHEEVEAPGPVEKVLDEVSLDGIVRWMQSPRCRRIITLAGAGISTSAGIPDFRSPETGLYHNLQKYNLPEPQAIFEINFFRQNPKPFFTLAKELFPGNFKPTVSHYFIRLLHEKGLLLRHYTQNIDTLERGAGVPSDKLVEAHGTFYTSHCLECRKEYPLEWIKQHIFSDEIPICTDCPGVVKPDIVFFGESLPELFQMALHDDFPQCDLLIIMGSSLEVQPFASLIDMVPEFCPRLLINRERAGLRSPLLRMFGLSSGGLQLDDNSVRDVAILGDCDAGCLDLADRLGWGDELRRLVASEHARLESENRLNSPYGPQAPTFVPAQPSVSGSNLNRTETSHVPDLYVPSTPPGQILPTIITNITHDPQSASAPIIPSINTVVPQETMTPAVMGHSTVQQVNQLSNSSIHETSLSETMIEDLPAAMDHSTVQQINPPSIASIHNSSRTETMIEDSSISESIPLPMDHTPLHQESVEVHRLLTHPSMIMREQEHFPGEKL